MEFFSSYPKQHPDFKTGTLAYKDEEFYVGDIKVENNRAIHGDEVFFHLEQVTGIKKRFDGFIAGILHLNSNQKYGFTKKNIPYFKFTPLSGKYPTFIVPSKCREKVAKYCVIKINKWETNNKKPIGQIEYLLGNIGNPEAETEVLLYKNDIYPKKNKIEYFEQVAIPDNTYDYSTFSIDPKGCRDIDDALHFNHYSYGKIEVGIHIANVASYLEDIKTNFFSSIYLKDKIIPMLDERHSFDECSLGNGEQKRSLSLILYYDMIGPNWDKSYQLTSYEFKQSVVKNTALSYEDAEQMIHDENTTGVYKLWDMTRTILGIEELSATKMVEHYMLLYNNMVAKYLYATDTNTILRTHRNSLDLNSTDDVLQKYLLKRQLNSATYECNPENTKHEGLDMDLYTHATSPIRRYVDIVNQINIIRVKSGEPLLVCGCLDKINLFQKNLRKFYNNYKKLDVIFGSEQILEAYIINIEGIKVSVFIPDLDFEHSFNGISRKLVECNQIDMGDNYLEINGVRLNQHDKVKIKITPLPFEEKFNKKIHISLIDPLITS